MAVVRFAAEVRVAAMVLALSPDPLVDVGSHRRVEVVVADDAAVTEHLALRKFVRTVAAVPADEMAADGPRIAVVLCAEQLLETARDSVVVVVVR